MARLSKGDDHAGSYPQAAVFFIHSFVLSDIGVGYCACGLRLDHRAWNQWVNHQPANYIRANVADAKTRALLAPAPLWTLEHLTKTLGIRPSLLALVILFSLLAWVCSASFAR